MPFAFSARDRQTLAWGGLALALILLVGRGLPAWRAWRDRARTAAAREAAALARATALVGARRSMTDSLRSRTDRRRALEAELLSGESPARAGAALAALVAGAADSAGLSLGALDVHPDSLPEALPCIRVSGSAAGDVAGIARFLALLEGGRPRVSVRALSLEQPDVGAADGQPEALRLEFTVEALARYGIAPGGAP